MSKPKMSAELEKIKKLYLKSDKNSVLFGEDNITNNLTRKLKKLKIKKTINL